MWRSCDNCGGRGFYEAEPKWNYREVEEITCEFCNGEGTSWDDIMACGCCECCGCLCNTDDEDEE